MKGKAALGDGKESGVAVVGEGAECPCLQDNSRARGCEEDQPGPCQHQSQDGWDLTGRSISCLGCGGEGCHHWGALQRKLVRDRQVPARSSFSFSSALLHGSLASADTSLGVGPWWPCAWAQLGRQGIGRGSPFGFCNTPRAQQGNPMGPKRKVAAVGLGEDQETPSSP